MKNIIQKSSLSGWTFDGTDSESCVYCLVLLVVLEDRNFGLQCTKVNYFLNLKSMYLITAQVFSRLRGSYLKNTANYVLEAQHVTW